MKGLDIQIITHGALEAWDARGRDACGDYWIKAWNSLIAAQHDWKIAATL